MTRFDEIWAEQTMQRKFITTLREYTHVFEFADHTQTLFAAVTWQLLRSYTFQIISTCLQHMQKGNKNIDFIKKKRLGRVKAKTEASQRQKQETAKKQSAACIKSDLSVARAGCQQIVQILASVFAVK